MLCDFRNTLRFKLLTQLLLRTLKAAVRFFYDAIYTIELWLAETSK